VTISVSQGASQGASQGKSFLARAFDLARPGVAPPLFDMQQKTAESKVVEHYCLSK